LALYETMADDLGDRWHGFATCMDHGDSLIVRHGRYSNGSSISLGPAANRPARRLLYGRTPAGHAEIPGEWLPLITKSGTRDACHAICLRDVERLPCSKELEDRQIKDQLRQMIGLTSLIPSAHCRRFNPTSLWTNLVPLQTSPIMQKVSDPIRSHPRMNKTS
jgi:hypothetical protein